MKKTLVQSRTTKVLSIRPALNLVSSEVDAIKDILLSLMYSLLCNTMPFQIIWIGTLRVKGTAQGRK